MKLHDIFLGGGTNDLKPNSAVKKDLTKKQQMTEPSGHTKSIKISTTYIQSPPSISLKPYLILILLQQQ